MRIIISPKTLTKLPMPRLMLTDEHGSKLQAILLEDRVYDKPKYYGRYSLIERELVVHGEIYLNHLAYGIPFLDAFYSGLAKGFFSDFLKGYVPINCC